MLLSLKSGCGDKERKGIVEWYLPLLWLELFLFVVNLFPLIANGTVRRHDFSGDDVDFVM